MNAKERNKLLRNYWPAWLLLTINYVLMMSFRGMRDYFASNVYGDLLHREPTAADYIIADFPAAGVSCAVTMAASWIGSNWHAINVLVLLMVSGGGMLVAAAILFHAGALAGQSYIILIGVGLYTAYTPSQALIFDRILGATRTPGTCVFLIFATDGLAYVGTIALLLYKSLAKDLTMTTLFNEAALGLGFAIIACVVSTMVYLRLVVKPRIEAEDSVPLLPPDASIQTAEDFILPETAGVGQKLV
jgi:hypothetical protein